MTTKKPKLSDADKARLSAAPHADLASALASEEAAAHVTAKYEKRTAKVGAVLVEPIDLRVTCACCGNPKLDVCAVCGN